MKRMLSTICMAAMYSVVAAAQSGSTTPGQADKKMDAATMTVTGCVAAGASAGHYMLTNATSSSAMDKDKDEAMPKDKMSTMSYMLMGGNDLKPHIGHKVEVTGTMAAGDMGKMSDHHKMAKDKTMTDKDKMSKEMVGGTLNVTSVKMISATCP
jgi:hypothetical protein